MNMTGNSPIDPPNNSPENQGPSSDAMVKQATKRTNVLLWKRNLSDSDLSRYAYGSDLGWQQRNKDDSEDEVIISNNSPENPGATEMCNGETSNIDNELKTVFSLSGAVYHVVNGVKQMLVSPKILDPPPLGGGRKESFRNHPRGVEPDGASVFASYEDEPISERSIATPPVDEIAFSENTKEELTETIVGNLPLENEDETTKIVSVSINLTVFFSHVLTLETTEQFITAAMVLITQYTSDAMATIITKRSRPLPEEGVSDTFEMLLKYIRSAKDLSISFYDTPLYRFFLDTLGIVSISGMCKGLTVGSLEVVSKSFVDQVTQDVRLDLPNAILRAAEFSLEVMKRFCNGEPLYGYIHGRGVLHTACTLLSMQVDFKNRMLKEKHGISVEVYSAKVERVLVDLREYVKQVRGSAAAIALSTTAKLTSLSTDIKAQMAVSGFRERPFTVSLYGKSGCGKTSITPTIYHQCGALGGYATHHENIAEVVDNDKFDPHTGLTNVVVFPDFNNSKDWTKLPEAPCARLRRNNDVAPTMAIKADVDEKNCIPIKPKLIIIGTNDWTLGADQQSNDPQSIYNRVDVKLEVRAKEYCRHETGKLIPSLIRVKDNIPEQHMEGRYMRYKVENGKVSYTAGPWKCMDVIIPEILQANEAHNREQARNKANFQAQSQLRVCGRCYKVQHKCQCDKPELHTPILKEEGRITEMIRATYNLFHPSIRRNQNEIRRSAGRSMIHFLNRTATPFDSERIEKYVINKFSIYCTHLTWKFVGKYEIFAFLSMLLYLLMLCVVPAWFSLLVTLFLLYVALGVVLTSRRVMTELLAEQLEEAYNFGLPDAACSIMDGILFVPFAVGAMAVMRQLIRHLNFSAIEEGNLQPKSMSDITTRIAEPNEWAVKAPIQSYLLASHKTSTTTYMDMARKIRTYCYFVCAPGIDPGKQVLCTALRVCSNYVILPKHSFKLMDLGATMVFSTENRKKVNGEFTVRLDQLTVKCIGSDHVAIVANGLPTTGDIRELFIEKASGGQVQAIIANCNDPDKMPRVLCDLSVSRTNSTEIYGYSGHITGITQPGDCCCPWISMGKINAIIGLHNARGNTLAVSELITRDMLECLSERQEITLQYEGGEAQIPIQPPAPLVKVETRCFSEDIYTGDDVDVRAACNFPLIINNNTPMFEVFGTATHTRGTSRSTVVDSLLSPHLEKLGIEQKWGPPPMNATKNYAASFQAAQHPAKPIPADALLWAVMDYVKPMVEHIAVLGYVAQPMNLFEGLNGRRDLGINPMNVDTSPGLGLTGKKYEHLDEEILEDGTKIYRPKQYITEEVERISGLLEQGKRVTPISKGSVKDEPLPKTKKKARIFFVLPMCFLIVGRMLICPIIAFIASNPILSENWFGIRTTTTEWDQVFDFMNTWGGHHMMNGDYSTYDQKISAQLIWAVASVFSALASAFGYSKKHIVMLETWFSDIASPVYAFNGTLMRFFGYQPSGNPCTVIVNSIVNALLFRVFFYIKFKEQYKSIPDVGAFRGYVHAGYVGDDSLAAILPEISHWFNMIEFSNWLAELGIKYTMPDKESEIVRFVNIRQASICKRYFRVVDTIKPRGDVTRIVHAPIEPDSIMKSLHCLHKPQEDEWLILKNNIVQGLRELSRHPKEVFEYYRSRIHEAVQLANGPYIPETTLSYDAWCLDIENRHFLVLEEENNTPEKEMLDIVDIFENM